MWKFLADGNRVQHRVEEKQVIVSEVIIEILAYGLGFLKSQFSSYKEKKENGREQDCVF